MLGIPIFSAYIWRHRHTVHYSILPNVERGIGKCISYTNTAMIKAGCFMYSWPHVLLLNLILYRVLNSYSVPLLGIELLTLWLVVQSLITQPHFTEKPRYLDWHILRWSIKITNTVYRERFLICQASKADYRTKYLNRWEISKTYLCWLLIDTW